MAPSGSRSGKSRTVSGFLKEVLSLKQRDVAEDRARIPLKTIREAAEFLERESLKRAASDPAETVRRDGVSFLGAMERSCPGRAGIIAEIKKASPSKGDIRVDLDPAEYAKKYTHAGASAISVLTESHYFKGSLDDLKAVRAVTPLPVLRKDFTLSSYQIYEARAAGANALLLIVTMLTKEQLRDYAALTRELGMEPLVEIHSEWELDGALFADARVIGINNRNLQTLETDTTVARRVVPFFTKEQIPVEASGISSPDEICQGMESGIFNFLVGESIVRAEDTKAFVHSLVTAGSSQGFFKEKREGKKAAVKICGLTSPEEARACVEAGADAIGLVFFPKSPRNVTMEQAAKIVKSLPDHVMTTGVFVDESFEFIMERVRTCGLKAVQLHGDEPPDLVRRLKSKGLMVIKALFAAREPYLDQAGRFRDADAILVEYGKGVLPGGNAESWNWKLAGDAFSAQISHEENEVRNRSEITCPQTSPPAPLSMNGEGENGAVISCSFLSEEKKGKQRAIPKLIIAGGLNPENIATAIEQANPWGVDLSSGVESSPGRKDIGKVKILMSKLGI